MLRHPRPFRRRLLWACALLLPLAGTFAYATRDVPSVRWLRSRGLEAGYAVVDPLLPLNEVPCGPSAMGSPLNERTLRDNLSGMPVKVSEIVLDQPVPVAPNNPDFRHEDLQDERVIEFARQAEDLLQGDPDVFQLSNRVRSLTHHDDDPLPASDTDPLRYLQFAREGKGLTCRYFAVIYGAAAVARGYTARLLGLSRQGQIFEHAVAEVYVPQFGKWVLVDPDFNVAYRKDGVWLDAWQLHELWCELKQAPAVAEKTRGNHAGRNNLRRQAEQLGVEMVVLGEAGQPLRESNLYDSSSTGLNLEYFAYVFYHTGNDFLGGWYPPGHPKRSRQYLLKPADAPWPTIGPEAYAAESRDSLYWPVGRTVIVSAETASDGSDPLTLQLGTWTPNFTGFEVRINNGPWKSLDGSQVQWKLRPGANRLEARSTNHGGLRGETTSCRLVLANPDETIREKE